AGAGRCGEGQPADVGSGSARAVRGHQGVLVEHIPRTGPHGYAVLQLGEDGLRRNRSLSVDAAPRPRYARTRRARTAAMIITVENTTPTATVMTEASIPKAPPVSQSGPCIVVANSPGLRLPETGMPSRLTSVFHAKCSPITNHRLRRQTKAAPMRTPASRAIAKALHSVAFVFSRCAPPNSSAVTAIATH